MKIRKRKTGFFSGIYGVLGAFLAAVCVLLALMNMNAKPVLLKQPRAAMDRVNTMLDALCAGDYDTVSGCLYGKPNLGLNREATDPVGVMFWDALEESFSYEVQGQFHATDSGVALKASITALDLDSVTGTLRDRARAIMENRIAEAENTDDLYDENNEYREEFVMDALYDAAREALEKDARDITWELTLNLIYENGQWWIMPDQALLKAISGGILS